MRINVNMTDPQKLDLENECFAFGMKVGRIIHQLNERSIVKNRIEQEFSSWFDRRAPEGCPRLKSFTAEHFGYFDWTLDQIAKQIKLFAWSLGEEDPIKNQLSCTKKQRNRLMEFHEQMSTIVVNTRNFYGL